MKRRKRRLGQADQPGCVYMLKSSMNGVPICKIGWTRRGVEDRRKSIQAGNPEPLTTYAYFESSKALATEKEIHRLLGDQRIDLGGGTEFFHWSHEVLQTFEGYWQSSGARWPNEWPEPQVPRRAPRPDPVPTPAPKPIVVETPRATSSYAAPSPRIDLSSWGPFLVVVILSLFAAKGCLDAASDRVNATVDGWFETLKSMKKR